MRRQADDRRHRARALGLDRCHQPAALGDQLDSLLDAQDAGGNRRRVLAEAVTGDEVGVSSSSRARSVIASEREKSAGWATSVRVSDSIGPSTVCSRTGKIGGRVGGAHVAIEHLQPRLAQLGAHPDPLRALTRVEEGELAHGRGGL